MAYLALVVALALPVALGIATLVALAPDRDAWREPGRVAWTSAAGALLGLFAITLLMRAVSAIGVPFGVASLGLPAIALLVVAIALARRRGSPGLVTAIRDAPATFREPDASRAQRIAVAILLLWIALRALLLLAEVAVRPLTPWDAWSAWATKAKTYHALGTIVPFVEGAAWADATEPAWTDARPDERITVPLLQAWVATALGRWDDALVNLPWWIAFVALAALVGAEVRRRDRSPTAAVVAAWLLATLPLAGVQVALAGYPDLLLAGAFALAAFATLRAAETRTTGDLAVAAAALALLLLTKRAGLAWIVVLVPGVAAAWLGPQWHRRILVALAVAVAALIALAARPGTFPWARAWLDYQPAWETLAVESLLQANWHLLALGLAGATAVAFRRGLDTRTMPLALVVVAGVAWIALLAAFPALRFRFADALGLNRAVLVLAPVAIVWMVVTIGTPRAASAPAAAPAPA